MREWGDRINDLLILQEQGVRPKALENRPVLLPGLDFYLNAYKDLCYDRPTGMGLAHIPWSSIIKWCHVHDIHDINEIDTISRYVRALERIDFEIHERREKHNDR